MQQARSGTAKLFLFLILWVATGPMGLPFVVHAQVPTISWSKPENLSNTPTSSSHAVTVSDSFGFVHVFWTEEVGGEALASGENVHGGNTIYYRKWDGSRWSPTVDILLVPDDSTADYVAATVDRQNRLHLVWTGQSKLYYSSALSRYADTVQAWSKPVALPGESARSQFEASIAVTSDSIVHVAYAGILVSGDAIGVFHTMSTDGGLSWAAPQRLSDPLSADERGYTAVRLYPDRVGRCHVTWAGYNRLGFGVAVFYARSDNGCLSWQPSRRMMDTTLDQSFTGSFPTLMEDANQQLHLIHVGKTVVGRVHWVSSDAGESWTQTHDIIQEMQGVNGYVVPVVDGSGSMHLVINMRPNATQITGIYYAPWAGDDFVPIVPVVINQASTNSAHYASVTVRLGNEIHVVWTQALGGEIWHVRGQISGQPAIPSISPPSDDGRTFAGTVQAMHSVPPDPLPIQNAIPLKLDRSDKTDLISQSQAAAIAPSVFFVVLLVACVLIWKRLRAG